MKRPRRLSPLFVLVGILTLGVPAWAQTPGTWSPHGQTFSQWAPTSGVKALHDQCWASSSVEAIVTSWTSGVVHSAGRLYLVRHGGHADSCWNGVVSINLSEPFDWRIDVQGSDRFTPMRPPNTPEACANKTNPYPNSHEADAASVHTYGNEFEIKTGPHARRVYSGGGIYWSCGGESVPHITVRVDLSAGTTTALAYTRLATRPGGYSITSAWNSARDRGLVLISGGAYEYNAEQDTYTPLFSASGVSSTSSNVAIDEDGGKAYVIFQSGTPVDRLRMIDYANLTAKYQTIRTTGGAGLENLAGAGLVFDRDPITGVRRLIGFGVTTVGAVQKGALFVMVINDTCGRGVADPCAWVKLEPGNGLYPPRPTTNGMWGRFGKSGCDLVALTSGFEQLWTFRPDWQLSSCGAPPPPQTFPVVVTADPPHAGTVTGGDPAVVVGVEHAIAATAAPGWESIGWDGDPVCEPTFTMPARAVACRHRFVASAFTLSVSVIGQATVTGPGSYPYDAEVTIGVAPASGWGSPSIAGECPDFTVRMTQHRSCTVTVRDVQAPVVTITAPAAGQIIKQPGTYQIGFTATDNAGPVTVVCKVNGQVVPCGQWEITASTPDGHYVIRLEGTDPTGNVGVAELPVTVALCLCSTTGPPPADGIAPRTWTALDTKMIDPQTGHLAERAWFTASKHTRLAYDSKRKRMMLIGGDYYVPENPDGSGVGNYVWARDLKSKAPWVNLHTWCGPNGVQPERPDNVTWVYDAKRDQGVVIPAYFFGATKCPTGISATKEAYTFNPERKEYNRANLQKPGGWGGDSHNHFGCLDPVTDTIYRWHWTGSATVQRIPLDGSATSLVMIGSALYGDMSNDACAMDVEGRAMYGISRRAGAVVKFSIPDLRVVETFPLPTGWVRPDLVNETIVAFDSRHRVLMHLNTRGYSGEIRGLYFLNVDTKTWEVEGPPADTTIGGVTVAYDPDNDFFLFLGGHSMRSHWLYRYAERKS